MFVLDLAIKHREVQTHPRQRFGRLLQFFQDHLQTPKYTSWSMLKRRVGQGDLDLICSLHYAVPET